MGKDVAKNTVNLDAMIRREDFAKRPKSKKAAGLTSPRSEITIGELDRTSNTFHSLRKPDFQRETKAWTPSKVTELIRTFVDGELVPAVILWRPSNLRLYVVDGAHRLGALVAWVNNDYGDGEISRTLYAEVHPDQQDAADETRELVHKLVGTYEDVSRALVNNTKDAKMRRRAQILAGIKLQVQMIEGDDLDCAEASFYRINEQGTSLDASDRAIIKSRNKPNAIATRAIANNGVGAPYWGRFSSGNKKNAINLSKEIHSHLFEPALSEPIKTLDLPIAGSAYYGEPLRLVFDLVNFANGVNITKASADGGLADDLDGSVTVRFLKQTRQITRRMAGADSASLGLHPAVYTYTATSKFSSAAFGAVVRLIYDLMNSAERYARFKKHRRDFEEFLVRHKKVVNQFVRTRGSGEKSAKAILGFYRTVLDEVAGGRTDDAILESLASDEDFKKVIDAAKLKEAVGDEFSREAKSAVYLNQALPGAVRCGICDARVSAHSQNVDHRKAKSRGGRGHSDDGQIAHIGCNSDKSNSS